MRIPHRPSRRALAASTSREPLPYAQSLTSPLYAIDSTGARPMSFLFASYDFARTCSLILYFSMRSMYDRLLECTPHYLSSDSNC